MRKPTRRTSRRSESAIDPEALQLLLDRRELLRQLQQSVHSFGVEVGLIVATELLGDEVRRKCGERHERFDQRTGHRYGQQRAVITMAGQKLPLLRPRVRSSEGEVELDIYRLLQRDDAIPEAVLGRMVRGASTRDNAAVIDTAAEGFGVGRSSVSRAFLEASRREVQGLIERRFEG